MNLRTVAIAGTLFLNVVVGGCAGKSGGHRASVAVPPDARVVSYGMFPMPPFHPPAEGTVYVVEDDTNRVVMVFSTNADVESVDFQTIPDEMVKQFKPEKRYRVFYSPAQPHGASEASPTTNP